MYADQARSRLVQQALDKAYGNGFKAGMVTGAAEALMNGLNEAEAAKHARQAEVSDAISMLSRPESGKTKTGLPIAALAILRKARATNVGSEALNQLS